MASSSTQGGRAEKRAKKPVKNRHPRRTLREDYYVQHTDKDMLLLIPSELQETVTVVKRVRRAEEDASGPITPDFGWGSLMPREIIHRVFQLVVGSEGAVPALCRLAQVCRLWYQVSSSPDLWQRVSVSRCWILPTHKDSAKVQNKVKNTIQTLIEGRLSQVCDFSLHHWKNHIPLVLQCLSSSCPLLSSLRLDHCSKVTVEALESVAHHCPHLTSLSLQNSQVDHKAVSRFLSVRGSDLRCLYLSFNFQTNNILGLLAGVSCPELRLLEVNREVKERMTEFHIYAEALQASCPRLEHKAVSRYLSVRGSDLRCLYLFFNFQTNNILGLLAGGSCPELRLLEVNREVKERMTEVHIYAEALQASCPRLEVLRLLNVMFSLKSKTSSPPESPGFTHLQELCLATFSLSLISDSICKRLLRDCTRLRVLDLRGCYRVTSEGICDLPCTDLERLYLGMYCYEPILKASLPLTGCCLLTRRWRHSLQELDLTWQNFSECDLSEALGILSGAGTNDTLQSLTLTGTKVPAAAVRDLLSSCRALTYLDLTSCRGMPRGLKCAYRGMEDLRQCLKTLSSRMLEEDSRE